MKKTIINFIIILLILPLNFNPVSADGGEPDLFFTTLDNQTGLNQRIITPQIGFSKIQAVQLDSSLLIGVQKQLSEKETSNLSMQVFQNLTIDAVLTKFSKPTSSTNMYSGFISGDPFSSILLAETDGVVNGKFTYRLKDFQLQFFNGSYYFAEIDQTQFPQESDPIIPNLNSLELSDELPSQQYDTSAFIDVMVVYTALARTNAGGTQAMENLINLAVEETNTGYSNSEINHRMRLVHTAEVSYNETNFNWSSALDQLRNTSDGVIDQVHTDRNMYGADLVVMIVNNTGYCGIGYLMQVPSSVYAGYGFSIVSRVCATGYYSFAHETGHNMGAAHDRANASLAGVYDYAYGYQAPDQSFRSIMAYNCPSGCPRINYWSNASININGQPLGVLYTQPSAAENFRALNNTASVVASFRVSTFVSSPTNLAATEIKSESVSMNFTDNSDNETGFLVERSDNGTVWADLLTLPAGQTLFSDTNVECATTYFYQVRSVKDSVYSGPSNSVQVTSAACAPPLAVAIETKLIFYNLISIQLSGLDGNSNLNVQTSPDGSTSWVTIKTLENNAAEFTIDGLDQNTTYYFRVESSNAYGSSYSNTLSVTTGIPLFLPLITH